MERNPYSPPSAAVEAAYVPPQTYQGFVPGGGRATASIVMLYVAVAVEALSVLAYVYLLARGPSGAEYADGEGAVGAAAILRASGILELITRIGCAIAFCMWFHRVYRNLDYLGITRTFAAGWAPGSFFVPFLNLVRPFQIAKEIWTCSDADRGIEGQGLVTLWWALFLISSFLGNVGGRMHDLQTMLVIFIPSSLLSIGAALACIKMILGIEARQGRASRRTAVSAVATGPAVAAGAL